MKELKIIIAICLLPFISLAQDTVYISQNKITTIQFPSEIATPISESDIDLQTRNGNLLLLKASDKQFQFISLKINTIDGEEYNIPIAFSYGRAGQANKVKQRVQQNRAKSVNHNSLTAISERIANRKDFKNTAGAKERRISADLGTINIVNDQLFFRLKIKNGSNINYDIDFIRFYVRDLKTAKRTVTQEREISPIITYGFDSKTVLGKHSRQYVFGLKKFGLARDKALFVEVYEKNGARHLYLKVKQADIEEAKSIK